MGSGGINCMKLRELFENIYEADDAPAEFDGSLKVIGVCFGRFNPPHKGHKAVWQAAASNPIWYVGTNKSTSGPKDPLPYDVKLQCMAAVWPKVAGHVIAEQSLLTLASKIYQEHGGNVNLKVYTDEHWLYKTLEQYNGASDKPHGMYKFNQIDWVKTERLASATNLRAAVRSGDQETFYKDAGVTPSTLITVGKKDYPMFEVVAHFLNKYPEKTAVVENGIAEQLAEMDLDLQESSEQKISKRKQQSTAGLNTYGDSERMSGDYTAYRLGMAVAGANGKDPIDMKAKSWIGKSKSTHPYTEEEQEMLKQAYKVVGANYKDVNRGDMKSKELDSTYKVSPVAAPKKNKYGV